MSEDQKKKEFALLVPALRQELADWYKEQVELEQAMAGTSGGSGSGGGSATNVWNASTRIKSLQVVDLVITIEAKMKFNIPEDRVPELVQEGGYANFEEMQNDLVPKLEKIYIAGGLPEKKKEEAKAE